jgi:hypothetical protein
VSNLRSTPVDTNREVIECPARNNDGTVAYDEQGNLLTFVSDRGTVPDDYEASCWVY